MSDEEKDFIRKVSIDKAKKKTIAPIIFIILSISTYVEPLMFGEFDFGIIFEVISLIFLIISIIYMTKYDETRAKRYVICSMIPVGWLLIYDIIIFFSSLENMLDFDYFFENEILSVLYLIVLFAINNDLAKADNPIKYKESEDWFWFNEKYNNKEK